MYNVLCCDDERDIVSALEIYLSSEDIKVFKAESGGEAIEAVRNNDIHLVLLDIMMPGVDGICAMSEIRKFSNVPIILLSAKSEDSDKILGLGVGADDYITKPFSPAEVIARVKSQLRRYMQLGGGKVGDELICIGTITIDDRQKLVTADGERVTLTPREYDILKFLMQNAGTVYSPRELYRAVWREEPLGAENAVAVHIRHIREKIEINPAEPRYLKVVWGKGYKLEKIKPLETTVKGVGDNV